MKLNHPLKVLVIDDEPDIQELLAHDFRVAHCDVLIAETGDKGIEIIKSTQLDVVISDIRMQNGGGKEVLTACSDLPQKAKPSLILITGGADLTEELAFDGGAEGYLTKPFSRRVLFETVSRSLQPPEERWKFNASLIPRDSLQLEIALEDLEKSIASHTFNIGRGGFFVAIEETLPEVGEILQFKINILSKGALLDGAGVVRWRRMKPEINIPSGIGLEILTLEHESIEAFLKLQTSFPTKAYIPRY